MVNFKELVDDKFSLLESVKVYKDMALEMFIPIVKTAFLTIVFVFCAQAVFSLIPYNDILNMFFGFVSVFILCIAMASFFKTAEDIILGKTPQIYISVVHVLALSLKLFAVLGIILGAIFVLLLPTFYIKNPLFSLPYRAIVSLFIIAVIPFVYFAPIAVVLREASIIKSFIFSYYMTLERWSEVSKSIVVQVVFVFIIAFWSYFILSLLFFPNTSDFFGFLLHKAVALSEQSRNLYIRFVFWEMMQIFVFIMISGIFIANNTILFAYLDGSLHKIIKRKNRIKINNKVNKVNSNVQFVDILRNNKPFEIDIEPEEDNLPKKKKEIFDNSYNNDALNEDFIPQDESANNTSTKAD